MNFKMIIVAILSAAAAIILYKNREESAFWLFGEIKTSKLILLGVFYIFGIITGAILFRRKSKHPKEYAIANPNVPQENHNTSAHNTLMSDEDKEFISRD